MDASQRIFTTPSFYQEFEPVCQEVQALNEQYLSQYLSWDGRYTEAKQDWINQLSILNKAYNGGIRPDPDAFYLADDNLKAFHFERWHYYRLASGIETRIITLLEQIRFMFKDIDADLDNGFLPRKKYTEYVQQVRKLIKTGNGLRCFKNTFLEN